MSVKAWPAELGQGLVLLAVAGVGALVGWIAGIPAGIIVGALLASGVYRLAGGQPAPWQGRFGRAGRLLLGTVIGAAFGPDIIAPLKAAFLPMLALVATIISVGLILGWTLQRITQLGWATAIISAIPGGLPAMAAMAEDVDADAIVVAAIHLTRLTTILVTIPVLIRLLTGTLSGPVAGAVEGEPVSLGMAVVTLALGIVGGLLALKAHVPTGDMVGPILVVGGINLLGGGLGPLPMIFRQVAMLLIGTSVGVQMSRQSLRRLRQVALPAAVVIVTLVSVGLLLGWGLSQVTPIDLTTALLCGVPGGASTMPIIAQDLGGDFRLVAALQLVRQLVMLAVVPPVVGYLLRSRPRGRAVAPSGLTKG